MKKIFYLFVVAIALTACSKNNEPAVTTYQIVNNVSVSTSITDLDGSMYQVIVLGYNNDNEVIQTDNIDKVAANGGATDKMKVSDNVTKETVN
ncbi:lipoprotein [Microbacter margulisiae]|uniref:Type IV secretion system putative lipoprotein virB7 n=1 Tax=Microbacter margulisiae TaxID=1350067 RepID=A0A7W5DPP3_9PORP|nr:lipoprotein [Microbacter margulisiae]MBB3186013.1 uncharacterized protein YcfL [Microbacter margulisiae]